MNTKQHRRPPHSWFIPIVVFAFVWLLMGELISIHQRAIFNFYVFDQHPFSTPDKSGKDKVFKLKTKKSGKDQVEIDQSLSPCITNIQQELYFEFLVLNYSEITNPIIDSEYLKFRSPRAPPIL